MKTYILCALLFMIGLYSSGTKKDIVKIIMGIIIMEYAASLLIASFTRNESLVLVILMAGIASTSILIGIAKRIYVLTGSLDTTKIRNLKG